MKYQMKKSDRTHLWRRLCVKESIFLVKAFLPTLIVVMIMIFCVFAYPDPANEYATIGALITLGCIALASTILAVVFVSIPILPGAKEPFLLFQDESTGEIVYQYQNKTQRFFFKGATYDRKGECIMIHGKKSRPIILPDNEEFGAFLASLIHPNVEK